MATITFVVQGRSSQTRAGGSGPQQAPVPLGELKQSIRIGTLRGSDTPVNAVTQSGNDLVVLHIENGPSLVLGPENARDLFESQTGGLDEQRGAGQKVVSVPAVLSWPEQFKPGAERGLFGGIRLAGLDIIGVRDSAAVLTAAAIVDKIDAQVKQGMYQLDALSLPSLKQQQRLDAVAGSDGPLLVLLHGTFSSTEGTFGKLWSKHPTLVKSLFEHYGKRVYALDHATLGESPIGNALLLAKALPQGARLHLLTHSRGGLVAEVMARACAYAVGTLSADDTAQFAAAGYARHLAELTELVALVKDKELRVERIVRVACPARGTLLASNRLDAYVSVLKWTLETASIPVLPLMVDFLGAVARQRTRPTEIPGLEAQLPDGAMVRWLHAAPAPLPGELRVVSGDVAGDSLSSWIKTLLADSYYWTDNDFVVQTSSMYGGPARSGGASFLLDRGGAVSHFTYFSNPGTAAAIVRALTEQAPGGFRTIGPLSAAGKDADGLRGARPQRDPRRPAVFVLPGIMGSHLAVGDTRIWLGWGMLAGLQKLEYKKGSDAVRPDGPVGLSYDKLCDFLSATHDVIEFSYDWRRPLEDEARRLAAAVDAELSFRQASSQPVRLLAHSMGGLLARVMQLKYKETWERLIARPGARVLMLGTPNGGSWAPMQVLSGDDSFGNKLVAFGAPFQDGEARSLMAAFPGFLQLQAGLLDGALGLDKRARWEQMAARDKDIVEKRSRWHNLGLQLRSFAWGIPPQDVLDQAVALRRELDGQMEKGQFGPLVMVTGKAPFTPMGYEYDAKKGLQYLDAPAHGDGRVSIGSALLPGVPAWQVDCVHGDLADHKPAFDAYLELLVSGTSTKLGAPLDPAAVRVPQRSALLPNRASRKGSSPEPASLDITSSTLVFGDGADSAVGAPLSLTIVNGNIKFVRQPLLLGHYRSTLLTGAERVIDKLIGGTMGAAVRMGFYPDSLRTHQVFMNVNECVDNPFQLPRPEGVIVVGLGYEGDLKANELSQTVAIGVIAWAQRLAEQHVSKPDDFALAATLVGSGGPGISPGASARAIAQGVKDANRSLQATGWPQVNQLHLVEMYLDRATDAWRSLALLAASAGADYQLAPQIVTGNGAARRALDTGYRGTTYDLITAATEKGGAGTTRIIYTLNTKRAREDVRAQGTQMALVNMLVKSASNSNNNDATLGFTLFKLLVPPEMEPFLGGTSDMQIQLDGGTAGIPWELLDTHAGTRSGGTSLPWSIRVKLLRTLRTSEFSQTVLDATSDGHVLVIGEPLCDSNLYPRLPGARREAQAVAAAFDEAGLGERTTRLFRDSDDDIGPTAFEFVTHMFARDWRIVHISGHGAGRDGKGDGGVVLSDGTFFGPNEIATMRVVPALVFINCCHLGAFDQAMLLKNKGSSYNRPAFAASVAEALIKKGVRCVIAAGWAVADDAASVFATTFYRHLIGGRRFIDAVAEARLATYNVGGNTWAAYQCYGDPNWELNPVRDAGNRTPPSPQEEFAGVCSANGLVLALDSIVNASRFQDQHYTESAAKVAWLEERFGAQWRAMGAVAEAFGLTWAEARELGKAIEWMEAALQANDGSAPVQAMEQLGNLLARTAWEEVRNTLDLNGNGAPLPPSLVTKARAALDRAVELLDRIIAICPTQERHSLCAAAHKRRVMLEHHVAEVKPDHAALVDMLRHYGAAEKVGRAQGLSDWCYPALNRLAGQMVAGRIANGAAGGATIDAADADAIALCLQRKTENDPDFFSVAGAIELSFYTALDSGILAGQQDELLSRIEELYRRVQGARWWNSMRDQFDFVHKMSGNVCKNGDESAFKAIVERLAAIAPRSATN